MKRQAYRLISVYKSKESIFSVVAGASGSLQRSVLVFMLISAFRKDPERTVNSKLAKL